MLGCGEGPGLASPFHPAARGGPPGIPRQREMVVVVERDRNFLPLAPFSARQVYHIYYLITGLVPLPPILPHCSPFAFVICAANTIAVNFSFFP